MNNTVGSIQQIAHNCENEPALPVPEDVEVEMQRSCTSQCCGRPFERLRYVIAVLGFWGFFCLLSMRSCINVALVAMVNTTDGNTDSVNATADRCPAKEHYNNSMPINQNPEFDWSPDTQNLILGVFYYGYIICQVPGGLLASYWKPQHVFGLTVFLSGILCTVTPFVARWNTDALIVCRFCMGFMQGPLFASNLALCAIWVPALERSTFSIITCNGATLGNILAPVITGYLCQSGFLGGWPAPFYLFGMLSILWYVLWIIVARDDASNHPWISASERQLVMGSLQAAQNKKMSCPPWRKFFTSRGFYALILERFLYGIGYYIIYSCYPMYMKTVLNYDVAQNGLLTAAPQLAAFIVTLIAGPACDFIIGKQWFSVTVVRKAFTFTGGMSMAVFMFAMGFVNCDRILPVIFLIIGTGLAGLMSVGPYISALDMSPQHAGLMEGVLNSFNNVGGFLSPLIVKWLTQGQPSRSRWQIVFFIAACTKATGILSYIVLGTSEEQKWTEEEDVTSTVTETDERSPLLENNERTRDLQQ